MASPGQILAFVGQIWWSWCYESFNINILLYDVILSTFQKINLDVIEIMKVYLDEANEDEQSEFLQLDKIEPKHLQASKKIDINEKEIRNQFVSLSELIWWY